MYGLNYLLESEVLVPQTARLCTVELDGIIWISYVNGELFMLAEVSGWCWE